MRSRTIRPIITCSLSAIAFFAGLSSGRVEAQVGIGLAYPGVPFLYYSHQSVPSPTEYLYDRDRARISQIANAVQQQAGASASATANPNAYFHRVRDFAGDNTYEINSRRSLHQRIEPPPSQPAATRATSPAPSRSSSLPLSAFFLPNGELDWPNDVPEAMKSGSARAEADASVKAVLEEVRSRDKAKAQSVGVAISKLVSYGQQALAEVRSTRSKAVAEVFHDFLLSLYQSLNQAAGVDGS